MIALALLAVTIPTPTPPLTALLERFRLSVPDARNIADLQVCVPHRIDRDGTRGTLMVAVSRPQQPRGYYAVNFRDGRYISVIAAGQPDTGAIGGFDTLIARSMDRRMEKCPFIPEAELDAAWAEIDGRGS